MKPRRIHILSILIVALGLLFSLAGPAAAQVTPGPLLATQFFNTLSGTSTTYALSPDALLHTPGGDYEGLSGISEFQDALAVSFDDVQFLPKTAVQSGNLVIVSFTLTGINAGSWHGFAANCASFAVDGVAMLKIEQQTVSYAPVQLERANEPWETFEQTVVVEQWISYDAAQIASQVGSFTSIDPATRMACDSAEDGSAELPPVSPRLPSRDLPY